MVVWVLAEIGTLQARVRVYYVEVNGLEFPIRKVDQCKTLEDHLFVYGSWKR